VPRLTLDNPLAPLGERVAIPQARESRVRGFSRLFSQRMGLRPPNSRTGPRSFSEMIPSRVKMGCFRCARSETSTWRRIW
jgi:hypothetical protein